MGMSHKIGDTPYPDLCAQSEGHPRRGPSRTTDSPKEVSESSRQAQRLVVGTTPYLDVEAHGLFGA